MRATAITLTLTAALAVALPAGEARAEHPDAEAWVAFIARSFHDVGLRHDAKHQLRRERRRHAETFAVLAYDDSRRPRWVRRQLRDLKAEHRDLLRRADRAYDHGRYRRAYRLSQRAQDVRREARRLDRRYREARRERRGRPSCGLSDRY